MARKRRHGTRQWREACRAPADVFLFSGQVWLWLLELLSAWWPRMRASSLGRGPHQGCGRRQGQCSVILPGCCLGGTTVPSPPRHQAAWGPSGETTLFSLVLHVLAFQARDLAAARDTVRWVGWGCVACGDCRLFPMYHRIACVRVNECRQLFWTKLRFAC